jgi:hypothetical protein
MRGPATEVIDAAKAELQALRTSNPSLTFIPNIGQERFLNAFLEKKRPFITVIGAGNGMGKTSLMAPFMVGCAYGPDEVSEWMERYPIWEQEATKRRLRGGPLRYRIICHADAMKENGPVLDAIKEWFPKGRYKLHQKGKTYYSQLECFDMDGSTCAIFDVKTHDQEKNAHAGANLDGVFADEPMPEAIYGETIGRCRKENAFLAMFLTPLEMAGWMMDQIIDDQDGHEIVVVNGSLWDNCKDIAGTRGHLSREVIERQIREWEKRNPHELEARVNGTFTHLSGAIYKNYNAAVHEVDDFPIPEHWPIYCIIDPHDSKPPFVTWVAQSEIDAYVIREWPTDEYTKLGENTLTIAQLVTMGRDIERTFRPQVLWRFMDPNKGQYRYNNTNTTVQQEYHAAGWSFELSEDDLQVGHQRVMAMLYYNNKMPIDEANRPYLRVFKSCKNTAKSLARYGFKKTAIEGASLTTNIDKKYKDPADNVRYFAMRLQPFRRVEEFTQFYETLKSGRVRK